MQLEKNILDRRQVSDLSRAKLKTDSRESIAKPKRIVALIPRGEVIRNFVYTGAFDEIADAAKLSILTVSAEEEMGKMLGERFGEIYPLKEIREKWLVRFQREVLDMAHGRWLWSRAAQERWRAHDYEARTARKKAVRTAKKIISYPFSNRAGLNILSKSERVSSRLLKTTDEYLELFKRLKPALVFNGSHIHCRVATQAIQAAQWLGIPTATFIFSWDNLTSQGRIMLPYDHFLVWNEALRRQLLKMYEWIRPEQVFVTGTPQFDFHFRPEFFWSREEFCRSVGADPSRPIVLYSTGMANHMPGEPEIVEEIADILKDFGEHGNPQLLVRVYPKDLTGRFDELKKRRTDILFPKIAWEAAWLTPKYEDSFALVNTLRHSAVGINVASTISLELCMFDKPVINVGYNPRGVGTEQISYADFYEFDHYKPVVESGAVEVARSAEEMRRLLEKAFENPSEKSKNRNDLLKKMFGSTLDGNSGRRVAQTLLEIAGFSR
jgi:hypothetical protein